MATGKAGVTQKQGPMPVPLDVPAKPTGTVPDVPANFQPLDAAQVKRLRKPTSEQTSHVAAMAAEITGSTTYVADFSAKAIAPATYAADLTTASAWETEEARALRYYQYAHNMAGQAWDKVLGETETFKKDYETGEHHDATVAERYPATTAFIGSRSSAAKRGAATKQEKKKAAAKPAAQTTTPAAAPAATTTKTGS